MTVLIHLSDTASLIFSSGVSVPLFLISVVWVGFLLLYDEIEIYPAMLTGKDRDGNEIRLAVCPEQGQFEQIYRDSVNTVS